MAIYYFMNTSKLIKVSQFDIPVIECATTEIVMYQGVQPFVRHTTLASPYLIYFIFSHLSTDFSCHSYLWALLEHSFVPYAVTTLYTIS